METPFITHLTATDFQSIYEPAEDSFLLIDAIEKDIDAIKQINPTYILEIGSGSGIVITALAKYFGDQVSCFATDINPRACELSKLTAVKNATSIETLRMDLAGNFRSNLFDIIVFNPPYVVTPSEEIVGVDLARSWAGGAKGREVTDRLLVHVDRLLTHPNGIFYLLTIEENEPHAICDMMRAKGFFTRMIVERKIRGEHLKVFRFSLSDL